MDSPDWKILFSRELRQGLRARQKGNEGMARVCARRAAGVAVGEYLERSGHYLDTSSVIVRLHYLCNLPGLSAEVAEVAGHFLLNIDTGRKLPKGIDLIAEANWLAQALLDYED